MRALIAEDNIVVARMLKMKMEKAGFEVMECPNGKEAINNFAEFNPSIILTDLLMPFTSGAELISHIRNEFNSNIPILVISSISAENTIVDTFMLGASDYVQKPLRMNEVIVRAKRLLNIQVIV